MLQSMRRTKRKATTGYSRAKKKQLTSYSKPVLARNVIGRAGLGTMKVTKMVYVEKGLISTGTLGAAGFYQYRLNSIFDPNLTGVGRQPSTHDQMAVLFETYTVTQCDFKITFVNNLDNNSLVVGYYIADRSTTNTDVTVICEQGLTDWKIINRNTSGNTVAHFQGSVDIPKLMGFNKEQYISSSNYQTLFGANPADVAYVTLFAADSINGGSVTIPFFVELVYHVRLQGTQLIPAS